MERGRFITLEGGEGAGKSTQARLLAERLRCGGIEVLETREPGGGALAERIRRLLLSGAVKDLGPEVETLLFYAAREEHVDTVITPALERGLWVISDRFADSTRAYQGGGAGVAPILLDELDELVVAHARPDFTIVLDLPPELGLARAGRRRGEADRFEDENVSFHRRIRSAFLELAHRESQRCVLIDAEPAPDNVAEQIWSAVSRRFALQG